MLIGPVSGALEKTLVMRSRLQWFRYPAHFSRPVRQLSCDQNRSKWLISTDSLAPEGSLCALLEGSDPHCACQPLE